MKKSTTTGVKSNHTTPHKRQSYHIRQRAYQKIKEPNHYLNEFGEKVNYGHNYDHYLKQAHLKRVKLL